MDMGDIFMIEKIGMRMNNFNETWRKNSSGRKFF